MNLSFENQVTYFLSFNRCNEFLNKSTNLYNVCLPGKGPDCITSKMTDPVFDLNFLASNSESSSSAALGMQSPLDQFELAAPGLDTLGCTGASMFAPLTGNTQGGLAPQQSTSGFVTFTSGSQVSSQVGPQSNASASLSRTSSLTDYSKHFSIEYSSGHNHQSPSQSNSITTASAVMADSHAVLSKENVTSQTHNDTSSVQGGTVASTSSAVTMNQADAACMEAPVIDIVINNVVCSFSTRCHLNLKKVAREGMHVIYKPENGVSPLHCFTDGPKNF